MLGKSLSIRLGQRRCAMKHEERAAGGTSAIIPRVTAAISGLPSESKSRLERSFRALSE